MVGRSVGRVLVGLGLLCASLAWTCWVVLHTVADPTRSSRVAHAVLDDPASRAQVAADLTGALAGAVNAAGSGAAGRVGVTAPRVSGDDPRLRAAVDLALADPQVATDLVDAFAAAHANLLGVEPKRDATLDTAGFVGVVARALATASPDLAARVAGVAPASIPLPDVELPFVARLRGFATTAVPRLVVLAVLLCGAALAVGDRPGVLRRIGWWGIGAGLLWAAGPPVLVWLVGQVSAGNAALLRAVLRGATGEVTAVATVLALGGVAFVAAGVVLGRLAWPFPAGGPGPARRSNIDARGDAPAVDPRLVPRQRHWTSARRRDDSWSAGWRPFRGPQQPRDDPPAPRARVDRRL